MSNQALVLMRLILMLTLTYLIWSWFGFELLMVVIGVQIVMVLGGIADRMDIWLSKEKGAENEKD
jgi:hypothetical protein